MIFHLPYLIIATVVLWFPRQWMRRGLSLWNRRKRRPEVVARREEEPWNVAEPGNPAVRFGAEFSKPRNYVDLLRATAGSVAVLGGFNIDPSLDAAPDALPSMRLRVLGARIAILLLGLLIQTVRKERNRLLFFAPIFYLFGLTLGLCGLQTALFSFVLVWAVNPMLKNPQSFLITYGFVVWAFGMFFLGISERPPTVAFVFCFLPVLLSLLARRPLVLFTRKGTRAFGEGT